MKAQVLCLIQIGIVIIIIQCIVLWSNLIHFHYLNVLIECEISEGSFSLHSGPLGGFRVRDIGRSGSASTVNKDHYFLLGFWQELVWLLAWWLIWRNCCLPPCPPLYNSFEV